MRKPHAKRKRASRSLLSGKRFDATEDLKPPAGWLIAVPPRDLRSCIRVRSQEDVLKRTKIVLALPSYDRQRLSVIRRGWCPSRFQKNILEIERVIRSDVSEAHRLSLNARVLSAQHGQVKAKRLGPKRLCRLRNRSAAGARPARPKRGLGGHIPQKAIFYPGNIWGIAL